VGLASTQTRGAPRHHVQNEGHHRVLRPRELPPRATNPSPPTSDSSGLVLIQLFTGIADIKEVHKHLAAVRCTRGTAGPPGALQGPGRCWRGRGKGQGVEGGPLRDPQCLGQCLGLGQGHRGPGQGQGVGQGMAMGLRVPAGLLRWRSAQSGGPRLRGEARPLTAPTWGPWCAPSSRRPCQAGLGGQGGRYPAPGEHARVPPLRGKYCFLFQYSSLCHVHVEYCT